MKSAPGLAFDDSRMVHARGTRGGPEADARRAAGFTLVEIVVTLALLLILSGMASLYYRTSQDESVQARILGDLQLIRDQIRIYSQAHHGKLPPKLTDVRLEPPDPVDPWNIPYYYVMLASTTAGQPQGAGGSTPGGGGGPTGVAVVGTCGPDRHPALPTGLGAASAQDDDWVLPIAGGPLQRVSAVLASTAASTAATTGTSGATSSAGAP